MKDDAAEDLHVEVPHTEAALRCPRQTAKASGRRSSRVSPSARR